VAARRGDRSDYIWVEEETYLYETANIFYRREAFEQSGGFPRDLQARSAKVVGGEDIHVAWAVKRAGWRSKFAHGALAMHDVIPITVWRWLFNKRLFLFPKFARTYPELRRFFYRRYFFDSIQARLVLALVGCALIPVSIATLLLTLPYLIARAMEPTRRLRGPLRVIRAFMYLPKDLTAFGILLAGSVRYRALLL
jgi:cellulose synthase/poly-beta-1,6-N-acetylglucosamine synthase-like glycosyltransferase